MPRLVRAISTKFPFPIDSQMCPQVHTSFEGENSTDYLDAIHLLIINQREVCQILNDEQWRAMAVLSQLGEGRNQQEEVCCQWSIDCSQTGQIQHCMQHCWESNLRVSWTLSSYDGTGKPRQLLDPETTVPRWPWQPNRPPCQGICYPHGEDPFNHSSCTQTTGWSWHQININAAHIRRHTDQEMAG